ncbi:Hypothetical protein, putative [Bodo saltans]|uniref:Ama1 protein n=1 Tax=Bodo saltans TaxID=75058 RepID=A0A0S4JRC5_BODSA|nr:Hypothetical protein, putative [Bodo saltans]|eukprot:CUG92752.1 Hypothetical protein, putative [Bodo saltans]
MQPPSAANAFIPNDYNTSLFECCADMGSCCETICCMYCQVSAQRNKLIKKTEGVDCCQCFTMACGDMFLCGWCLMYNVAQQRMDMKILGINEGYISAWCKTWCCLACSVCQTHREMSIRHHFPGGCCVKEPYQKAGVEAPRPMLMTMEAGMGMVPLVYPQPMLAQPMMMQQPGMHAQPMMMQQQPGGVYGQPMMMQGQPMMMQQGQYMQAPPGQPGGYPQGYVPPPPAGYAPPQPQKDADGL